jgi:hypothetical protein
MFDNTSTTLTGNYLLVSAYYFAKSEIRDPLLNRYSEMKAGEAPLHYHIFSNSVHL